MTDIFTPVETNAPENAYSTLVGDGKKFADNEALARAKLESDRFIEQLKREQAEVREELNKRLTAEEILTQIKQSTPQPTPPSLTPEPPKPTAPSDINELVKKALSEQTTEQKKAANMAAVTQKLAERFGADSQLHLNKKAAELGMSLDDLKRLAQDNPALFFKAIDADRPAPQVAPVIAPRGGANLPPTSGERDKAYYDKLRQSNPKYYFSEDGRMQQYKDMERALKAGKNW